VRNQGHAELLEALSLLESTGLEFSCMLVGEGPEEESLRMRARELGFGDRLHPVGFYRDVSPLLWAMDLFVLPWTPSSPPSALLEAMACGLPCVAVNGGCIPEIIRDGDNGLLVPADQPKILARIIEQLARSASRREALGQRTRAHVRKVHSSEVMTERYARMYLELMNREV
jgi:glycosyltransferase involved in cell wall biosynthesis